VSQSADLDNAGIQKIKVDSHIVFHSERRRGCEKCYKMKKQHTGKKDQKKIATKEGRQVPVCCNIGSTGRPSLVYEYVEQKNKEDLARAFEILIKVGMRKLQKLREQKTLENKT